MQQTSRVQRAFCAGKLGADQVIREQPVKPTGYFGFFHRYPVNKPFLL
jgi:hypothetical protein